MRDEWRPVVRPSIPPAFWLASGVWAGAWFAEEAWWRAYAGAAGLGRLSPVLVCASAVLALVRGSPARRIAAAGLALGLLAGSLHGAWWRRQAAELTRRPVHVVRGVVTEDPESSRGSVMIRVRLQSAALVSVSWPKETTPPLAGQSVVARTRLQPLDPAEEWSRRAAARGVVAQGRGWGARVEGWPPGVRGALMRRRAAVAGAVAEIGGDGGPLLAAVLLGDRRRVSGSVMEEDLRAAGLAHLLAASSIYAGALAAAVVALARRLGRPRWAQLALAGAVMLSYAAVAGFRPSLVRALLAFSATAAASLTGRRHDALAGLSLGCVVIVVGSPSAAVDLGLGIGAAAVTGLCLFSGLARRWAQVVLPRGAHRFALAATAACVVQVSTLPLIAPAFGVLPLAGPLGALVAVPLATSALIVGGSGAALAAVSPVAAHALLVASALLLAGLARVARFLAGLRLAIAVPADPWLSVGLVAVFALVWLRWPQPLTRRGPRRVSLAVSFALAAWLLVPPAAGGGRLMVLDVGQGDAIVVRDGGRTMLVDAAASPAVLRTALARQRIRSVDVLVLTHPHADHTGGLAAVPRPRWTGISAASPPEAVEGERADCGRVFGARSPVRALAAGDSWRLGRTQVRVAWPPRDYRAEDTNDASVVLLLTRGNFTGLLTGDAEVEPQRRLAAEGAVPPLDILKVAHHGSSNGVEPSALASWTPPEALVSVGEGNDFGHPHAAALAALARAGARVRRTDREGDLVLALSDVAGVRRARSACATISRARATARPSPRAPTRPARTITERDGHQGPRRPEAHLPHLRGRGVAARTRGPPTSRAALRSGRPRLQLRRLRR